jgi:hypothetical protein
LDDGEEIGDIAVIREVAVAEEEIETVEGEAEVIDGAITPETDADTQNTEGPVEADETE